MNKDFVLIKLTDYDTGDLLLVVVSEISAILPIDKDGGKYSRVDMKTGKVYLILETSEQVLDIMMKCRRLSK